MSVMALSSCTPVRRASCSECAQCLDDQVALRFRRRKQIDVLLCRSDVRVARWQSGNLFRQLARCPLRVESHGAVPFWRWSGDDVDAGQLVYPLIAFSHVGDAVEMRPASWVAGDLVLLGMPKLVRPTKRSDLGRGCAPEPIEIRSNKIPASAAGNTKGR